MKFWSISRLNKNTAQRLYRYRGYAHSYTALSTYPFSSVEPILTGGDPLSIQILSPSLLHSSPPPHRATLPSLTSFVDLKSLTRFHQKIRIKLKNEDGWRNRNLHFSFFFLLIFIMICKSMDLQWLGEIEICTLGFFFLFL